MSSQNLEAHQKLTLVKVNHSHDNHSKYLANSKVPFLRITEDVRRIIFKFCLVNKDLGSPKAINIDPSTRRGINFGLQPQILRVCRQIYHEASQVLYGTNKFYNRCYSDFTLDMRTFPDYQHYMGNRSALTRHIEPPTKIGYTPHTVKDIPAYNLVQQWTLVYDILDYMSEMDIPGRNFVQFLQAICGGQVRWMDVLIIPKFKARPQPKKSYKTTHALRPLGQILRRASIELRDASSFEIDEHLARNIDMTSMERVVENWPAAQISRIIEGAKSQAPFEACCKMWPLLLKYAQTFEQFLPWRYEMGLLKGESPPEGSLPPSLQSWSSPFGNPYKDDRMVDPLEGLLLSIKEAADIECMEDFKSRRGRLLEYLEKRYRDLHAISVSLNHLTKAEKRFGGYFGVARGHMIRNDQDLVEDSIISNLKRSPQNPLHDTLKELVFTVEEFTDAFRRELPRDTMLSIRRWKSTFDKCYDDLQLFRQTREMSEAFESQDYALLRRKLKIAISGVEKAFLEMDEARKHVFAEDHFHDPKSDIDLHFNAGIGKIKWNVNEPKYYVKDRETTMRRQAALDEAIDDCEGLFYDEPPPSEEYFRRDECIAC